MKKLLFIACAFVAFSNMAAAQAKANPAMTPPPSKEQLEKDNSTKAASADKLSVPAASHQSATTDANRVNYKKAGLNEIQIAQVEKQSAELDQRKADIEKDNSLTPEQKKNGIAAIETERSAVLRKSMGEDSYKRYTIVTQTESKAKPTKSAPKKATAN